MSLASMKCAEIQKGLHPCVCTYLCLEAKRESKEDGQGHAYDVEGHQVGPCRQVLPPAASGNT
jgi:hypothetical protein